jgi:ferredoxin-NADP reductase
MSRSQTPPDPETAPRPKIKKLEVMVAEVIRETPDTATLVLFTGNDRLEYKPGHFLTIDPHQFPALERFIDYFEETKGKKEPARAYSLSSAPHEQYLAVTVKEERYIPQVTRYPPLLSPLMVWRIQPGTRMVVTGFGGPYVLPDDIDVIFRRELDEMTRRHPDRLDVVYALSREPDATGYGESYHSGRVDADLVRKHITDPSAVEVFACGPAVSKWERLRAKESGQTTKPRFMETVLEALDSLGVGKDRIHRESYG